MSARWRLLTMATVLSTLAACALRPALVTLAPQPQAHAWWLRTQYQPTGQFLHGIAVRHYDPDWCAADAITSGDFPRQVRVGESGLDRLMAASDAAFSLVGTFGSGEPLEVLLGAYATCSGGSGSFVAVLAPGRDRGANRIVQVERLGARMHFQYLSPFPVGGFTVFTCFQCDDPGRTYHWNAGLGRFQAYPPEPST